MPKFTVDVKAFISVTVLADTEADARTAADAFAEGLSPTPDYIIGWNSGLPEDAVGRVDPDETGEWAVDGESDVEEEED